MPSTQPARLAIFRSGRHTTMDGRTLEFSDADLSAIAGAYSPDTSEAPLVVGHPKFDDPAYGWVKSLSVKDSVLYAEPHQVEAQFAELANTGRFKKISASLYMPDSPGNPTPGKLYLRHVGFLGAAAPSVKGLKSAQFSEADGSVEFASPLGRVTDTLAELLGRIRDWFIEREGVDKADQLIPTWQIHDIADAADAERDVDAKTSPNFGAPETGVSLVHTSQEIDMTQPVGQAATQTADFAEREAAINARQTAIDAREKAIADREAQARREDAASFAESLVTAGQLLPREKAPVVELLMALPSEPVSFAEGDDTVSKPGAEVLRGLLSGLPKRVDYAEKSASGTAPAAANFAAPAGQSVDATQLEVHRQALAYQADHPNTAYLAAVKAVGG